MNDTKIVEFRKYFPRSFYYTTYSFWLTIVSIVVFILIYSPLVLYSKQNVVSNICSVLNGVLSFSAINSFAVLLVSSYLLSIDFDSFFNTDTDGYINTQSCKKQQIINYRSHILPALIGIILILLLSKSKHLLNKTIVSLSYILFSIVFVLTYLSIPVTIDNKQLRFTKKLSKIYNTKLKTFVMFIAALLIGFLYVAS